MDGSRKLTLALGLVALVSTGTALALALRPGAPEPRVALPPAPADREVIPDEARAPGGPNAIAEKAVAAGGPRTPVLAPTAGGPRRSVTSFEVAFDAAAPGSAWACVAAAGAHAVGRLDAGGTAEGLVDPTVAAACAGAGPDTLEGFVRVATMPLGDAAESACDVTVSFTLTRAGTPSPGKDLRGGRVSGGAPANCNASLAAVEAGFAARLAAP